MPAYKHSAGVRDPAKPFRSKLKKIIGSQQILLTLGMMAGDKVAYKLFDQVRSHRTSNSGIVPEDAGVRITRTYNHYLLFRPNGKVLKEHRDRAVWFRYLKHLDGGMYESFAVHWRGYRSLEEWLEHLEWAEQTQKLGKGLILVAQGEKNDLPRHQFAYASYLLIANGRASFRYAHQDHYRTSGLMTITI